MSNKQAVYIGLCNPKSPSNVGAVMRAAGCYGAGAVRYTGERFARAAKFHTDTQNAKLQIPLTHVEDLVEGLPKGISVVCVELAEGATPLPEFTHPDNALYIFGPEDASVPQKLVNKAHDVVYIPTVGSMNLAATVNVLLYDRLAKAGKDIDHEQRIKQSRDVNNNLVVKNQKTNRSHTN